MVELGLRSYASWSGYINVFEQSFPQIYRYLTDITLIDDYLARKLETLEISIFGRILEPRLDKKVIEILNKIYEIEAEGVTYIPVSPTSLTTKAFRLAVTMPRKSLHIDELGDGTKYAISILSLCLLLENSALLIEEIESHQHPEAMERFLQSLINIAQERNVQLFITTHSLEVIQLLSKLPEEFDIRFFHLVRSSDGTLSVRRFKAVDVNLLYDLGVDLRKQEAYKKFLVVEGDEDKVFIESLFQRYGRKVEEVGYLVKAGGKSQVNQILAALASTGKEIVIVLDYDKDKKENLINSILDSLRNRNYRLLELEKDKIFKIENTGSLIIILPTGLPDDDSLKRIGITQHEIEDYCLKLIELDYSLKEWAGITLEELAERARNAKFEGLNRSKTLLRVLAAIKGISYEEAISYIVKNASKDNLEKIIGDIKQIITLC
ncbi:MAG TPA: AAA family ATPase [Sulfolobales archaeon]|nr:AAA family ATPase [Sulfolobales archaeon]